MDKILIVEDTTFFGSIIEKKLRNEMGAEPDWVQTFEEAQDALSEGTEYSLALLNLNLPDNNGVEIAELGSELSPEPVLGPEGLVKSYLTPQPETSG